MSLAKTMRRLRGPLQGLALALAVVLVIIGALWLYSGVWPPLVVIESNSMQHADDRSFIGVIDTGDLVILKKATSLAEVRPYLDSVADGYRTYSGYGDVVIYRRFGDFGQTPIIHRALCQVVYNATGGGFDVPALARLEPGTWQVNGGAQTWYNIKAELLLFNIGHDRVPVRIDFASMLANFASTHIAPHGGLITLGDNNQGVVDQSSLFGVCWRPVEAEWLNGVARGEIPWFGLIKLYANGQASQVPIPPNSETNLIISLALLIGVPIAIDVTTLVLESRGVDVSARARKALHLPPKQKKQEKEDEEEEAVKKERSGQSASSAKGKGGKQSGQQRKSRK